MPRLGIGIGLDRAIYPERQGEGSPAQGIYPVIAYGPNTAPSPQLYYIVEADAVSSPASAPDPSVINVPDGIANLTLWLRGDLGVTLSGGKVTQWDDQSVTGASATQGTDAKRPTTQVLGGQTAIKGGSSTSSLALSGAPTPTSMSLFMVFSHSTLGNTYHFSNSASNFGVIEGFDAAKLEWFNGADRYTLSTTVSAGPHIAAITQVNAGALIGYYDSVQAFSHTATVTIKQISTLLNAATELNGSTGNLAELIVYSRVLNATELTRVHNYLKTRYGIS